MLPSRLLVHGLLLSSDSERRISCLLASLLRRCVTISDDVTAFFKATQLCDAMYGRNTTKKIWMRDVRSAETTRRMKRQQDIQRILEDFKGVKNIPGIKSAKKSVLITKITRKGKSLRLEKGLPMSSENSTKNYTTTKKK